MVTPTNSGNGPEKVVSMENLASRFQRPVAGTDSCPGFSAVADRVPLCATNRDPEVPIGKAGIWVRRKVLQYLKSQWK